MEEVRDLCPWEDDRFNWGNKQRQLRLKRTLPGSSDKGPRVPAGQGGPV